MVGLQANQVLCVANISVSLLSDTLCMCASCRLGLSDQQYGQDNLFSLGLAL